MLVHTHVYYSNRFELGTLFPDTFRIDRSALLSVQDAVILNVDPFDKDIDLESNRQVSYPSVSASNIAADFGYTLLYIMVPSKDFNLNESMDAQSGTLAFDSTRYDIDVEYGHLNYEGVFVYNSKPAPVEIDITSLVVSNMISSSSNQITVV